MTKKKYSKFENQYRLGVIGVEHKNKLLLIYRIVLPVYLLVGIFFHFDTFFLISTGIILLILFILLENKYYKYKVDKISTEDTEPTILEISEEM